MSRRLRSAGDTLTSAVAQTIEHLDLQPEDVAAGRLALRYAEIIDAGDDPVDKFGPALLRCLESLGATPAARSEIGRRVRGRREQSELDRLRAARRDGPPGGAA